MSRLVGLVLTAVCACATLAIGRPAAAQELITTYYAPAVAAPVVSQYPVTTAYYAPAPVTAYYAPTTAYYAPTTAYYGATTSYYAPRVSTSYYVPTPVTTYYAPAPVTSYYAPAPVTSYYAPGYYYARPTYYVPGEPVRNFFRAL